MIEIGQALSEDCPRIADIQVRGWQAAYRGLIPDDFLDKLNVEKRIAVWKLFLHNGTGTMLVSKLAGQVTGFCHLIPSRDADGGDVTAEIAAIYVDPDHWRSGYGRQLCSKTFTLATQQGFRSLTLWVLTKNSAGRAFYEAMGMLPDGATKREERPGFTLDETRYRIDLPLPGDSRSGI
jgi:GNAT superfamily N-acetyltransferase